MDEPKKADQFNGGNKADSTSSSGGVMDIQSPKPTFDGAPALPASGASDTGLENLETTSTVPLTASSDNNFNQPSPANNEPVADSSKVSDDTTDNVAAAAADETSPLAPNPLAIPPHAAHKSNGPVVAIVVAIVVALALGGLVIFTFTKSKDTSRGTNSSAGPAPVVSKPLASPADVDATSQELEGSLSQIDEDKDFSSEELSDKSLGL